MEIKTILRLRFHLTNKNGKSQKKQLPTNAGDNEEKGNIHSLLVGLQNVATTLEINIRILKTLKTNLPNGPAIPLFSILLHISLAYTQRTPHPPTQILGMCPKNSTSFYTDLWYVPKGLNVLLHRSLACARRTQCPPTQILAQPHSLPLYSQ